MATAQVLFQRFYYFKSFVNNPMEVSKVLYFEKDPLFRIKIYFL